MSVVRYLIWVTAHSLRYEVDTSRNVALWLGDLRPAGRKQTGELFLREKEKRERPTLFVHLPPALSDRENYRCNFDWTSIFSAFHQGGVFVAILCNTCVLRSKGHSGCKKLLILNIYLFISLEKLYLEFKLKFARKSNFRIKSEHY